MSADYTPTLGNYTELKPFRYWCQKVLPLVYDDSLSYYELLCKVVDYLNKTMEDVETLHDDVDNLHYAYEQLQQYVNDYFDNLDLQDEINNTLDEMAEDGTLSNLIAPLLPDLISSWLSEHITPTSPIVDNTLSVSGAAADAKVTGDNLRFIKNSIGSEMVSRQFVVNAGAAHSSNADLVDVSIPANEPFYLEIDSRGTQNIDYRFAADGDWITEANRPNGFITLDSAISTVGVYVENNAAVPATITFRVIRANSALYYTNMPFCAYFTNGNLPKITYDNSIGTLYLPYNLNIIHNNQLYTAYHADILTQIGTTPSTYGYAEEIDANTVAIHFANAGCALCFDETDLTLKLTDRVHIAATMYPLLILNPNGVSGGALVDSYMENMIRANRADIDYLNGVAENVPYVPVLRNGSIGNPSNTDSVTTRNIIRVNKKFDYVKIRFTGDTSAADNFGFSITLFSGATDGMTTNDAWSTIQTRENYNFNVAERFKTPEKILPISWFGNYDHFTVAVWKLNGTTYLPIRIATEQYSLSIEFLNQTEDQITDSIKLLNARHVPSDAVTPLTLLHFSDLHKDTGAMNRIIRDAASIGVTIDGKICTGDMVNDTAEQISSWWDSSVMTCIGNHDTASYNAETGYNWTALSMANRDAYYIAPFESNWAIQHTSGTSYYYKDYASQKVRLIVMDAMLYNVDNSDATNQTTWLEGLLADAITNSLHVLIAIHSPHGGATPVDCSFSKYGETTMPTYTDCNTPQAVIDAVAAKITNGLHFIGYIVGHNHQDDIWDAEGDGKQLMYCITCSKVNYRPSWYKSDQDRTWFTRDAYNLITIDTANTLVKIIRGGGANIDDHMRTRKAICIDYSTGTVVGEVL